MRTSRDRTLRFLANVDPIDVARALDGLDAEETLVVVISKTFTTAETMLNARTVRSWLIERLGKSESRDGDGPLLCTLRMDACGTNDVLFFVGA